MSELGASFFDAIVSGFQGIANMLGLSSIAVFCLVIVIAAFLVLIVIIRTSYETKLLKAIEDFNHYFHEKPSITDENLVEFNNKMKEAPRVLRNRWQVFILNREEGPSKYINIDSCVEKPLRTSSIDRAIKNFILGCTALAVLAALFSAALMAPGADFGQVLFESLLMPAIVVLLMFVFAAVLRALKNAVQSDLFEHFHIFESNINRAVISLPGYIDYETLFTKKEIRDNIPVLQQYLEKRAFVEQQELEKARKNSVEVESYNFDELGINGALVLERAMRECEIFLSTKKRLQLESDNIETERANYEKNYEISSKDYQRRLQVSRENLENLKKQQEQSTNRIEGNYIKKQQADEIKKQQQIEKDADIASSKYDEEQKELKEEIEKRKLEIEEHRQNVEDIMKMEFKNYAKLIFVKLKEIADSSTGREIENLTNENTQLKGIIKQAARDDSDLKDIADNIEKKDRELQKQKDLDAKATPRFVTETFNLNDITKKDAEPAKKKKADDDEEGKKPETKIKEEAPKFKEEAPDSPAAKSSGRPVVKSKEDSEPPAAQPQQQTDTFDNAGFNAFIEKPANAPSNKNKVNAEDALQQIHKKIQEESEKLSRQKEEFSTQINGAINKIDEPKKVADEAAAQPETEKPRVDDLQFMLDAMQEDLDKKGSTPKPKPAPRPAAQPAPRRAPAKKSAPKSWSSSAEDIDNINAEMEKILQGIDKTKK